MQLANILSKMSQMFTELNSIYLRAMLDKQSLEVNPEFNTTTLLHQFEKEILQKKEHSFNSQEEEQLKEKIDEEKEKQENIQKKKSKQTKFEALKGQKELDQHF